ncbi:hypothetical protein QDY30_27145 (plasmid) [Escherichia coli]|nr:hypothetical protein QDY30_27145 [Escherichia coli]
MPLSRYRIGTEASANPVRGRALAQVIAKWLLTFQLLRDVGLEQWQLCPIWKESLGGFGQCRSRSPD